MMSEIHMILTEELPPECETIEQAEALGYKAEYGRDNKGEIYARWIQK